MNWRQGNCESLYSLSMNPKLSLCPRASHEVTTADASIVLIYDSFATALRGKAFCEQLSEKLEVRTDLGESLWRSDLLAIAAIRHEGACAALAADFVVLSLRGDEELSDALDHWFAEWMPYVGDREPTLVVLFDPATAQRDPTNHFVSYARTAAFVAGVHFFAHTAILGDDAAKRRGSRKPTGGVDRRSPERPTKRRPVALTTIPATRDVQGLGQATNADNA